MESRYLSITYLLVEANISKSKFYRLISSLKSIDLTAYQNNTQNDGKRILYNEVFFVPFLREPLKQRYYEFIGESEVINLIKKIQGKHWIKKFNTALRILDKYSLGIYSLESCCTYEGVPYITFYSWTRRSPEIGYLYDLSNDTFQETIKKKIYEESLFSLLKIIQGYIVIESNTIYDYEEQLDNTVRKRKKEVIIKERTVDPNPSAIIYALSTFSNGKNEDLSISSKGYSQSNEAQLDKIKKWIGEIGPISQSNQSSNK